MRLKFFFRKFLFFLSAKKEAATSNTCGVNEFVFNCVKKIAKTGTEDRRAVLEFLAKMFRVDLLRLTERQAIKAEQLTEEMIVSFLLIKGMKEIPIARGQLYSDDLSKAMSEVYNYFIFFEEYQNNETIWFEFHVWDTKDKIKDCLVSFLIEDIGFYPIEIQDIYKQNFWISSDYKQLLKEKEEIKKRRNSDVLLGDER